MTSAGDMYGSDPRCGDQRGQEAGVVRAPATSGRAASPSPPGPGAPCTDSGPGQSAERVQPDPPRPTSRHAPAHTPQQLATARALCHALVELRRRERFP